MSTLSSALPPLPPQGLALGLCLIMQFAKGMCHSPPEDLMTSSQPPLAAPLFRVFFSPVFRKPHYAQRFHPFLGASLHTSASTPPAIHSSLPAILPPPLEAPPPLGDARTHLLPGPKNAPLLCQNPETVLQNAVGTNF